MGEAVGLVEVAFFLGIGFTPIQHSLTSKDNIGSLGENMTKTQAFISIYRLSRIQGLSVHRSMFDAFKYATQPLPF